MDPSLLAAACSAPLRGQQGEEDKSTRPGALGGRGSAERQEGEEAEDAAAQLDLCSCFVYCVLPPTANAQKTETAAAAASSMASRTGMGRPKFQRTPRGFVTCPVRPSAFA